MKIQIKIIILAQLLFFVNNLLAQKKTYNLITHFSAKADDKTDCYPALLQAAATLSKEGGGTLVIPKGKYYIGGVKIHGGSKKNNITDVVFKNCNGLTIIGNNSTFRVNGDFTRSPDYSLPGLVFKYSYSNSVCPFVFSNCKNVSLKNIVLTGEIAKTKNGGVVEGACYGISIYDAEGDTCTNILFENITTHGFAADGFIINTNGSNIKLKNCASIGNARQGLSITKGKHITVYNCRFDSTGHTGAYGWHGPGSGIDIENEFKPGDVDNLLIRKCTLRGNKGFQIVSTIPSFNVTVDSCFIKDNKDGYSDGLNGIGLFGLNTKLENCIIYGCIQVDLGDQRYIGPKVQQIHNNIIYTGNMGIVCSDFQRPVNIENNIIIVLPKPVETYFPYIQSTNCSFNKNIILMNADALTETTAKMASLVQFVKEASNNFWLLNKKNSNKNKNDLYYHMAFTDAKIVGKQFYPQSKFSTEVPFKQKRLLTGKEEEKIMSTAFLNDYSQKSLNTKYLAEAKNLRLYLSSIIDKTL